MPGAVLRGVTLDCAHPQTLADFYGALTGMRELFNTDEFVALTDGSGCDLGFQRVDGYRAPQWPGQDVPQQFHLDFRADDHRFDGRAGPGTRRGQTGPSARRRTLAGTPGSGWPPLLPDVFLTSPALTGPPSDAVALRLGRAVRQLLAASGGHSVRCAGHSHSLMAAIGTVAS